MMVERSYENELKEALQRFSLESDIVNELAFLESLDSDSSCRRHIKSSPFECFGNGLLLETGDVDLSVSDIEISLYKTSDFSQKKGSVNDKQGSPGPKLCLTDEDGNCDVDLGFGELSQWSKRAYLSPASSPIIAAESFRYARRNRHAFSELFHGMQANCYKSDRSGLTQDDQLFHSQDIDLNYICDDFVLVEEFIRYVFIRRYGSADSEADDGIAASVQLQANPRLTASLNKNLDAVIKRLMVISVNAQLAAAFSNALEKAAGMPTVRKKLLEHIMLWLNHHQRSLDKLTFKHVKTLIITGLSDAWSVVRKTCCAGVAKVFKFWSVEQQEDVFGSLMEICINKEGSWQSKDGAAFCVHAILFNCFAPDVQQEKTLLPSYIVECVLTVVFSLVSHPQVSVRESVNRILTAYIEHVDSQDMKDLMHQALMMLTSLNTEKKESDNFHCVDAYAAEGLLSICTSIIKRLPVGMALQLWLAHHDTFLAYLSHDASSVRQTISTLCMHIAIHHGSNAMLLKLVLYHLTEAWHVSFHSLSDCFDILQEVDNGGMTWEGKEGRMLVYELLCQYLLQHHKVPAVNLPNSLLHSSMTGSEEGSEVKEAEEDVCRRVAEYLTGQPLLTQLYLLDNAVHLADKTGLQVQSETQFQELQRWLLAHSHIKAHESGSVVQQCNELLLPSCKQLLLTMLQQTAVCLAHTQWELRRISQQVLPYLFEVICLYDVELIMLVWKYTTEESNLLSFIGLSALHQSLALYAKVMATDNLIEKASALASPIYHSFVDGMKKHIADFLPLVMHHLQREVYDRISVTAVEIAVLVLNFFNLQTQIKENMCSAIVLVWRNLFTFAHPKSAMTVSLFPVPQHRFQAPYESFLSCCLVHPESNVQCAKQVQKNLMLAIHRHLSGFLLQLDICSAAFCLPLLAHNIGLFIDDTNACNSLINSFSGLCQSIKTFTDVGVDTSNEKASASLLLKSIYFTVQELTAVIAIKSLDLVLLQKLLNCYLTLCKFLQPEKHIPLLLHAVSARMNEGMKFHISTAEGGDVDVKELCWHKPELPPDNRQNSSSQHEASLDLGLYKEENESDCSIIHSDNLGLPVNNHSSHQHALNTTDSIPVICTEASDLNSMDRSGEVENENKEEDGDWDSWSEEEAEASVLQTHFQMLFRHLATYYGAEGKRILQDCGEQLGKEGGVLTHLMQTL